MVPLDDLQAPVLPCDSSVRGVHDPPSLSAALGCFNFVSSHPLFTSEIKSNLGENPEGLALMFIDISFTAISTNPARC